VAEPTLLTTGFNFRVTLTRTGAQDTLETVAEAGFQECTGLDIEMEVQEYQEGGRNNGVYQRAGRAKYPRLVLKRGLFHQEGALSDGALWRWIMDVTDGVRPIRRYDGDVKVLDRNRTDVVAHWRFVRGLPAKVVGPQLNARTGEVAIEELHIAHEGLRMVLQ
jgi:phage tail-like protein